jgi:choline dehydrogenase-like flavoprotein
LCESISRGTRAVGVEYVKDTVIDPDADQTVHFVRASKLVVVSAGTFGSPTILERSGIGSSTILTKTGVKQVVDLPGVGENHHGMKRPDSMICHESDDSQTITGVSLHTLPATKLTHSMAYFRVIRPRSTVRLAYINLTCLIFSCRRVGRRVGQGRERNDGSKVI